MISSASLRGAAVGVVGAGAVAGALLFGGAPWLRPPPGRVTPQASPVPGRRADRASFPSAPAVVDGVAMMVGDMAIGVTAAGARWLGPRARLLEAPALVELVVVTTISAR